MTWNLDEGAEIKLCQELVKTPSLSGKEEAVASTLGKAMLELGYHEVFRDKYGDLIGKIKLGSGGAKILLEGHMDHVDVPDKSKWTYDPFKADIIDGKIYGRGTSDMKGNLAAMTIAASRVAQEKGNLNGEIYVVGSVYEEIFEGVAPREISRICNPDFVIIGEASNLTVKRGQRGRAEIIIETQGISAHSSTPSVGVNAVKKMSRILELIDEKYIPKNDPFLGEGILEVTDIISYPYPGASVIPERCRATFDRRLLVGETEEDVIGQIESIVETVDDPQLPTKVYLSGAKEICYTGETIESRRFAPAWAIEEDAPLVRSALNGLKSVDQTPTISHYFFCTNGSHYAGEKSIPTIGYGGSLETLAHVADEYIEIDQLKKACNGYYGIIKDLLKRQ